MWCEMRTIIVEPYNPKWVEEFEKIKNEILPIIVDDIISFEHVGSTSVVGLWAKQFLYFVSFLIIKD